MADSIFTYTNMFNAKHKCLLGTSWKGKNQRYNNFAVSNMSKTIEELNQSIFEFGKFSKFNLIERGKLRHITSLDIKERVVQRCFCDSYLTEKLERKFIYDNMACQTNKGVHCAQKRLKYLLEKYLKKYGDFNGYILQFDFHHYFDSIPHDKLIAMVLRELDNDFYRDIYSNIINSFEGDCGLGLGSQVSQISALYYLNDMDHFFKGKKDVFAYGRYMDDGFIIAKDKETLKLCLKELHDWCDKLELTLNDNKTFIRLLDKSITYLKVRYVIGKNNKVIMLPNKKQLRKNKVKLKKMYNNGCSQDTIDNFITCIEGNLKHYSSYHLLKNFNDYNNHLFSAKLNDNHL